MKNFWKVVKESLLWIKYIWEVSGEKLPLMIMLLAVGILASNIVTDRLEGLVMRVVSPIVTFFLVCIATFFYRKKKNIYLGWISVFLYGFFSGVLVDSIFHFMFLGALWLYIAKRGEISPVQVVIQLYLLPLAVLLLIAKIVSDLRKHKIDKQGLKGEKENNK